MVSRKKRESKRYSLKFGKDDKGNTTIQRLCFSSLHSEPLHQLLADPRLQALTAFLHPYEGRVAENEKDGLVINNYINTPNSTFTQMGWHTDSPRDLFMGQKIGKKEEWDVEQNDISNEESDDLFNKAKK